MNRLDSATATHPTRPSPSDRARPNPDRMSTTEIRDELAELLATSILRAFFGREDHGHDESEGEGKRQREKESGSSANHLEVEASPMAPCAPFPHKRQECLK